MDRFVDAFNGVLDRTAMGLKAFSMRFPRGSGITFLHRTRYDYATEIGQGLKSSLILSVVGWARRNFPNAPVRVRSVAMRDGKKVLTDIVPADAGPGFMLKLLAYPNEFYSGVLLWQATIIDYMTAANAYWAKVRNGSDRVVELWWIPSWLIKPKWDTDGSTYISYYEYNPNGIPYRLRPDDIVHFRDGLDPQNPRMGLNGLVSLAREIYTDEEASNFAATILTNLGVPGVVIAPKDTSTRNAITDPESVKRSFMEKTTGDKRGEPLVLTAPTDVTMLSFSPQQLTLRDLRRLPEERVSGVTGIPAIVAGFGAGLERSTFANMDEAKASAYEENIIPTQVSMAADLRVQLLIEFVGDIFKYEVDFDLSNVRVLQEDQDKLWARNLAALGGGAITRRAFKENVGQPADELDDVYYIPVNVTVTNVAEEPPEANLEEPEPLEQLLPDTAPMEPGAVGVNGNGNGNREPVPA